MNIPILSNKPKMLPKELEESISKLDIISSLMLIGLLLEHTLRLHGLQPKGKQ